MNTTKKFSDEIIIEAVKTSISFCEVCKKIGCKDRGGSYYNICRRIKNLKIDISHFYSRENKKKKYTTRLKTKDIKHSNFRTSSRTLRKFLLDNKIDYCCNICKQSKWLNNFIQLEVDHIDNNCLNNNRENLRFLCPNCHSQKTFNVFISNRPSYQSLVKDVESIGTKNTAIKYKVKPGIIRNWLLFYEEYGTLDSQVMSAD